MPRDGSGIYHRPVGTDAVPDTTVESSKYNNNVADVETDLNVPRPIVAGGTGGSTITTALTNLGAEFAKQAITNYGSAVFQPGSFFSLTTATAPPVAGHAFVGTVLQQDANNMMLVAQDLTDTVDPGRMWAREMTAGVWGNWTMVSDPYVQNAAPTNPRAGQLWWDTVSGLLYVYFDDGTSKQWVATTPLLTPGATLDFPTSPSVGTKFPAGSQVWTWDGAKWITSVGKTPVFIDGSTAMTAQLTLVGDPVNPTDAADKHYVDATPGTGSVRYDAVQSLTQPQKTQAQANIGMAILRGYIAGYQMATVNITTFSVGAGQVADSTATDYITLTSAFNKTTSAFAAGSGAGSLDTGSIAASSFYHVYAIKNPTSGAVDLLTSLGFPTPTTLPSGFTLYRRIGSIGTIAGGNLNGFIQFGDEFIYTTPIQSYNTATLSTVAVTVPLAVPTGLKVWAKVRGFMSNAVANTILLANEMDQNSVAPNTNPAGNSTVLNPVAAGGTFFPLDAIRTDTSGQIRIASTAASTTVILVVTGYRDNRGKDA